MGTHVIDSDFLEAIRAVVGDGNLILDKLVLEYYSTDAFGKWHGPRRNRETSPVFAVVRPGTTEQVAEIVKLACDQCVPLMPYGGGTGVMGALNPLDGTVAVDMKDINVIENINVEDMTVTVGSGVVLGDLDEALGRHGLMLGHDPYSVPIATVGGAISTNGVGYRAAKYGSMGDQVLGLEIVLPTGQIIETRAVAKTSAGPSLHRLFIGSEGVFGIITRATLRVFRIPETRIFQTVDFQTFEDGFHAMLELFSLDLKPALVDLTEEPDQGLEGTLQKWKTTMYLVFEGFVEEVEAQLVRTLKVCIRWNGEDVGPDIARNYWDTRHDSAYRYKERYIDDNNPQSIPRRSQASTGYPHVALPPSRILEYRKFCHEVAIKRNLNVREYSLWTRPELFSIILVDMFVDIEEESNQLAEGVDEILKMAQDLGGSMEYVHGVGVKLVHLLPRELGESMELLKNIKFAIDPYGIMNPGNLNL